jgi:hypothetical protein
VLTIIKYLPEIYSLVSSILKHIKKIETDQKIKSDLDSIQKAFDENDSKHLNDIFNNKLPDDASK